MANQTINQLTAVAGQDLDRAADKVAVWDNSATVTKGLPVQDVVTTGTVDPGSSSQVTTRVNKIVACTQTEYDNTIAGGGNTPDSATLYVITDGKTKDSYVGQIDTLESKTYTIDPYVVSDRDISRIYVAWTGTAGGTIDIQVNGVTAGSQIALTGTSPSNQDLSGSPVSVTAGQAITLVAASVDTITNVLFAVEYTQ